MHINIQNCRTKIEKEEEYVENQILYPSFMCSFCYALTISDKKCVVLKNRADIKKVCSLNRKAQTRRSGNLVRSLSDSKACGKFVPRG